jgi:hypothetical protein
VQQAHPDDPFAANHLLCELIFKELFRIGALDSEAYAGDSFLSKKPLQPLDPKMQERIKQLTDKALALSQARLDKNPKDVDALYARGITRGLRSTYMGMGQKAWFGALRSAVGARRDHERVLELDPKYTDAKNIVGIHLYVLGSLSWPVKVAASVAGLSGNKQKGLEYLREDAASHGESATDAKVALALFLRREQKYKEALQIVGEMQTEYPRNFLIADEYAHLLNASGQGQAAVAAYRKVVNNCKSNAFPVCRLEQPAFGLGESLRGQRDYQGAAEAYELAASVSDADPDLKQRATLSAGEMYDVLNRRDAALQRYHAVIAVNASSSRADLARHYIKQAYKVN